MNLIKRSVWGALPVTSFPGTRVVNDEATVHWSASGITPDGTRAGRNEPLVPPRKPGRKWYRLWSDPNSPKAQRRKLSRAIRKYNKELREYRAKVGGANATIDPRVFELEKSTMRQFQSYHMLGHGWSDIGYHFVIFASGNVYEGRRLESFGAHAYNANHTTGVCFVMGPGDTPTAAMIEAFTELKKELGIKRYRGHNQVPGNATQCPGPDLKSILRLPQGY